MVLCDEAGGQFEAMRLALLEEMQIGSAVEKLLLEDIAASAWRLRRITRIEKEMMEDDLSGNEDGDGDDGPETVTLGARLSRRFADDNAYNRLSRYEGRIRRGMVRLVHELHILRQQDRIENAELYRRRLNSTWSGSAGEREVRGPDLHRQPRNEDAVAAGYGVRDGAEPYEDYHIAATDEYATARADYERRMADEYGDQHGAAAPAPPADGRSAAVGEPARDQTGRRISPPPGDADRPPGDRAEARGGPPVGEAGNR